MTGEFDLDDAGDCCDGGVYGIAALVRVESEMS